MEHLSPKRIVCKYSAADQFPEPRRAQAATKRMGRMVRQRRRRGTSGSDINTRCRPGRPRLALRCLPRRDLAIQLDLHARCRHTPRCARTRTRRRRYHHSRHRGLLGAQPSARCRSDVRALVVGGPLRGRTRTAILGMFINISNVMIVAVSADGRYGPLYDLGIAQVVYTQLVQRPYPLKSGTRSR